MTVASTLHILYGLDLFDDEVEEVGMYGWEHIGNKLVSFYNFNGCTSNCELQLPCNADIIEAVTSNAIDYQKIDNLSREDYGNKITESYIESRKTNTTPYYTKGKFLDYQYVHPNTLRFTKNYTDVNVLYKGIILDDDGLPQLTNNEVNAIACYIAYVHHRKLMMMNKDKATAELANYLAAEWRRLCDNARAPEYLNQNDMDKILNAKNSWNRKTFNISYKPVL